MKVAVARATNSNSPGFEDNFRGKASPTSNSPAKSLRQAVKGSPSTWGSVGTVDVWVAVAEQTLEEETMGNQMLGIARPGGEILQFVSETLHFVLRGFAASAVSLWSVPASAFH
jgi:hypothetical protein